MTKRILITAIAVWSLLIPAQLTAQGAGGGGESILGLPIISARVETSDDSLFFVDGNGDYFPGNIYNPSRITLTVWVKNIGETGASPMDTAIARGIEVSVRTDTRFNIVGAVKKPLANSIDGGDYLVNGDSASVTFELEIAAPRSADGLDEVAGIVVSQNANYVLATKDIWVEHEYFPVFRALCTKGFADIVWDEDINDYNPNPFQINLTIENIGDGSSLNTVLVYIGTPDVSLYESDEEEKDLGVIRSGESKSVSFLLRPRRRNNDTTLSLCFQVRGVGGYKEKYYLDTCCVDVFIPAAKQPEYDLTCTVEDSLGNNLDFVEFKDHRYQPDPFVFKSVVRNIGTALGKDVCVKIILPASLNLAPGETEEKCFGDLPPGNSITVTWRVSPTRMFERDTLMIRARAFDAFNNQGLCGDSVVVDSIRRAIFDVSCICPDTIYADQNAGIYLNSPFDVFFNVRNVGSDYADSVKATILIQNPVLGTVQGFGPVQRKDPDSLSVDGGYTFVWPLEASPAGIGTTVRIKFTVQALNAEPVDCICEVYVQRLDAPNLDIWCETIPEDSLHFDPRTGGYFPPTITYRVCATNAGGGVLRNVKTTLSIPPRMILADGETSEKTFPRDIGPNDTVCVEWLLIPVQRTDFGSNALFLAEATAENVTERPVTQCDVFVPALPNTAALSIPRNNVGYYNQVILVPIFIDDPDGKDIKKFEIELRYNINDDGTRMAEDVVEFLDVVNSNSLTGDWNVSNVQRNPTNDLLNFTLETADDVPLTFPVGVPAERIPPLVWMRFRGTYGEVSPDDLLYSATPVKWPEVTEVEDKIRINDGSIFPRVTDGLVTVSGDCLRPLTASPDYAIFNKPNPFNPSTTIEYTIPTDEHVKITVFDALGRAVDILVDEYTTAGMHSVVFDAKGLPSGIYFYRLETPQYTTMKKMVVAK